MANVTLGEHFRAPNVNDFLDSQLGDKKGEFVSNVLALSESSPKLLECNPNSLMKCALNATALNLPLNKNLGHAYVIPYNKKVKNSQGGYDTIVEPQFQIGWKGLVALAIRSGQYKTINACEVRVGEINRNKFTGEIEFLGENNEGDIVGYLAYVKMLNGFEQSIYMTIERMMAHADKYSMAFTKSAYEMIQKGEVKSGDMWKYSSPWYTDFEGMAKKTVLKSLLSKYGALSTEMQKAVVVDQQIDGKYSDNPTSKRTVVDAEIITQSEPIVEGEKKVDLNDL